jgi:mono/diheme cytochrome c family protein
MNKINITLIAVATFLLASCGGEAGQNQSENNSTAATENSAKEPEAYDPNRGEGKFTAENVTLGAIDPAMADMGESIAGTKCTSCHKLTDERLVGPGWKGVTERRTAHWIMNFITNPDPMIDKDPEVQAQLELCLVRMPNQNLADEEARNIVEYMRKNDSAK